MDLYAVHLRVRDWQAALAWYRDRLGLEVEMLDEPRQYALLRAGSSRVALKAGLPRPEGISLIFQVSDLKRSMAELEGRGVQASGEIFESLEGFRQATYSDLDGHRIDLFQWVNP